MKPAFRTAASVRLAEPEPFLAVLLEHLETHAAIERTPDGAVIRSAYGDLQLRRVPWGMTLDAVSASAEALATVKTFVADHVFEFAADARIDWSGHGAGDAVPSHFQEAAVVEAFDVTPRMRRVVFRAGNIAALATDDHHHVRLLVPPEGRPPRWPTLAPDGRIAWPEGEDTLASRVYTLRAVDERAGTFSVDFVLHHDGAAGPGVAFARRGLPGAVAGLLGPGGSGLPAAENLLLLGDEAALPAIARIAERAPPPTRITAIVEIEDEAEKAYLDARPGLEIIWLCRYGMPAGRPDGLAAALADRLRLCPGTLPPVWAGCEHTVAAALRQQLHAATDRRTRKDHITAYWKL